MNATSRVAQLNRATPTTPNPGRLKISRMEPVFWVEPESASLLDVGCNDGALLADLHQRYPNMQLAGIDINSSGVEKARTRLPAAEIHQSLGYELPFANERFQYVTCIEVLEHIPQEHRRAALLEMRRVLQPGGRLILRVPHAGAFDWLDAQNFRFRFPGLYRTLVGEGKRDGNYRQAREEIVWHHHFTREELLGLAGDGWEVEACEFGGLFLFPVADIVRWPFYRAKRYNNWFVRIAEKIASAELGMNFGRISYDVLVVLKKPTAPPVA